jgi:hypothetical protein
MQDADPRGRVYFHEKLPVGSCLGVVHDTKVEGKSNFGPLHERQSTRIIIRRHKRREVKTQSRFSRASNGNQTVEARDPCSKALERGTNGRISRQTINIITLTLFWVELELRCR